MIHLRGLLVAALITCMAGPVGAEDGLFIERVKTSTRASIAPLRAAPLPAAPSVAPPADPSREADVLRRRIDDLERGLALESRKRNPTLGWLLSFLIGFGAGHIYADSGAGWSLLLAQSLSLGVSIVGAAEGSNGAWLGGLVVNRLLWVIDWATAIPATTSYNRRLEAP